jgi:hypothetical protein
MTAIGTYGAHYLHRAGVAYEGLGAHVPEHALYPTVFATPTANRSAATSNTSFTSTGASCRLRMPSGRSRCTNERQLFTPNPINRYAIGDRDKLVFNADGSLDLFVQRDTPGADKESNWLPTPKSGSFTLNLRVYWPKAEMLDGSWLPSPVKRMN